MLTATIKAADPRGKGTHRRRAVLARNHTILCGGGTARDPTYCTPIRIPAGSHADPEKRHLSSRPPGRRGTRRRQLCSDEGPGSGKEAVDAAQQQTDSLMICSAIWSMIPLTTWLCPDPLWTAS